MPTTTPTVCKIELLAPARNAETGIEAIRCGADAVYIGAPQFGARAAATNTLADIERLVRYAHTYDARVYVTLNTIIYESEQDEARAMALQLHDIGVDAIITQDWAFHEMQLPIPLNASTQMDIRSAADAKFLSDMGFRRIIMARELSLDQIRTIHAAAPEVELEAFVHGALCVSYSGQCYASWHCFSRSANRGECAQFCRLAFNLNDADGRLIARDKHLLSLKDLNRSAHLEAMIDAGVVSFKIEGRLKDMAYVKNVTSFYHQALNAIIKRRPDLCRASSGHSQVIEGAHPDRTFNRGYTEYFLHGRTESVCNPDTPKSVGQPVGHVKRVNHREVRVAGLAAFHNGDGLCYYNKEGKLCGFRVNRAEGNVLHTAEPCRNLAEGTPLYRNYDAAFTQALERPTAERTLDLVFRLTEEPTGFALQATDQTGTSVVSRFTDEKQLARTPQHGRIVAELQKLGGTAFRATDIVIDLSADYFLPAARVAEWRRSTIQALVEAHHAKAKAARCATRALPGNDTTPIPVRTNSYEQNIANHLASEFYRRHGVAQPAQAYELTSDAVPLRTTEHRIMTCRHCIRYTLGLCTKHGGRRSPYRMPFTLSLPDGQRFTLKFNCTQCEMEVYAQP